MKVIGNLVLMIFALNFSALFLLWTYQEEFVDKVGFWMVLTYKSRFDSEGQVVLQQLRAGETQPAIELLEKKKWREIQNRDRAYPMKRRVLASLSEQLHNAKQYEGLLHWSGVWRKLDERDVNAMAYWYEALRHTPNRREEGILGLQREWRRFPSNEALTTFHLANLVESGDSNAAAELRSRHRRDVMDAMSKGWRVTWNWRIQQALARPVRIELATHLDKWQLIAAWNDIVGIWRSLWKWRGDDRLTRAGFKDFSISPDDEVWVELRLRIPKFMTTLRIDPPPGSRVQISDIQIIVDDVVHPVLISQLVDDRHYKRMIRDGESLKSTGDQDPWVRMNIVDIIGENKKKVIDVVLQFRAAILISGL